MRLIAAFAVLISHCYPLYGLSHEPFAILTGHMDTLGGFSVSIFFIISGFLITSSWERNKNIIQYTKNRVLRIFPALFVIVIISVFVFGPTVTSLSSTEYWSSDQTFKYLLNMFAITKYNSLPGVFENNPSAYNVNGSLWTLAVELFMYCVILLAGVLSILNRKNITIAIVIMVAFFLHVKGGSIMGGTIPVHYALKHIISFLCGAFLCLYFDKITWNKYWALLLLSITLIAMYTSFINAIIMFTLPYLVIYVSTQNYPILKNAGKYGDFSYGMYIYSFPVQQYFASIWKPEYGFYNYMLTTCIATLIFAIASWHLIEKNALKLRK